MPASSTSVRAFALALAATAGTASAGQFDYIAYAGIEHSDNVTLSATNPISQNTLTPGINFTFLQQGSTIQANVAGTLEYRDYLGNAFDNQTFTELSGQVNWTVVPQRLDFTVQDFAGVEPLSTLSSNAPNNQQQTNVISLGPTLHFRLGHTLQGQAELRYINSDASKTKQFNSSRGEAALRVFKDLNETDQLSANVDSQHVHFTNAANDAVQNPSNIAGDPDYSRNELFGRYTSKLAHFDIDAALGWSQIDFHAAPSASSALFRMTLGWRATPRSSFSITAARQFSDAAEEMMLLPGQTLVGTDAGAPITPVGPVGINTGTSVIDPQVYLDRRLEGTYMFHTERLTLSVSPLYGQLHYLNLPTFDQTSRSVSSGLNYRLGQRLSLQAFADQQRLTYQSLARRDKTTDYGLGLSEQRTPHWSWRVTLTHRQRNSTVPEEGYRDNEIYFGVAYKR